MEHVEIAKRIAGRNDIEKRLTGRFYTPTFIADRIAEQSFVIGYDSESIGDPFCGDGRLILSWLRSASSAASPLRLRRILLWDYDAEAVTIAKERVLAEISSLGLKGINVEAAAGDTFGRVREKIGALDLVVTNPPWELLKPDVRDALGHGTDFKGTLRSYAAQLAELFPGASSARGKAMTGYGVNLARAGAIASSMLTKANGTIAIVLPASIFADQASTPFRQEFFTRLEVRQLDWYPAEARLFAGVDQPFVTVIARSGQKTKAFSLRRFDKNLDLLEQRTVEVESEPSKALALTVDGCHDRLVQNISNIHPPLSMLESDMRFGLWLGRELDETRLAESLARTGEGIPFLKGRHVFPFAISRDDILHIDPAKRVIPPTVKEPRLAWRDVSRPTQKRRMHVALVPKGNVTGNSLGVAYFRYGSTERIRVLMAIMNSMAFELQVRTHLATAHVSQGVLRKCSFPLRCFEDKSLYSELLDLTNKRIQLGEEIPELEAAIARAYALSRHEFEMLLDAYPKLSSIERNNYIRIWQ